MNTTDHIEELGVYGRLYSGSAAAKILDFFLQHDAYSYTVPEATKALGLSNKTVFIIVKKLYRLGILKVERTVGNTRLYKWNENSKGAKFLSKAATEIAFMEQQVETEEQEQERKIIAI